MMQAPPDRASLRLLHGGEVEGGLEVCARLSRQHFDQAPGGVFAFATEPPWKLRLMEQACGQSKKCLLNTRKPFRHPDEPAAESKAAAHKPCSISHPWLQCNHIFPGMFVEAMAALRSERCPPPSR